MKILDVGGGGQDLPPKYSGWDHILLDVDADVKPDICIDAREMQTLNSEEYDVVYSSHCLEHFQQHEVRQVLKGFLNVLNFDGYADIRVPNLTALFKEVHARNHELTDVWYRTSEGNPITFHDVLYGWGSAIYSGKPYYAHKCGFTAKSLHQALANAGFKSVWVANVGFDLYAIAYRKEGVPCPSQ